MGSAIFTSEKFIPLSPSIRGLPNIDCFPEGGTPLSALKKEVCDWEVLIEIITAASDFWLLFFPLKREGLPESVISIFPFLRF